MGDDGEYRDLQVVTQSLGACGVWSSKGGQLYHTHPELKDHFRRESLQELEKTDIGREETAFTRHDDTIAHRHTAAVIVCKEPVQVQTSPISAWMREGLMMSHPYLRNHWQLMTAIGKESQFSLGVWAPIGYKCLVDAP